MTGRAHVVATLGEALRLWDPPTERDGRDAALAVRRFGEVYGDLSLGAITPTKARLFAGQLECIPDGLPRDLADLPLRELLARPDLADYPTPSAARVARFVGLLAAVFDAAGTPHANPFAAHLGASPGANFRPAHGSSAKRDLPGRHDGGPVVFPVAVVSDAEWMAAATPSPLEKALEFTYELRWRRLRSGTRARHHAMEAVHFLLGRGVSHPDQITTPDLLAFVAAYSKEAPGGGMRHKLSALRVLVSTARELVPPLATRELPRLNLPRRRRLPKWWLGDEEREALLVHLRGTGSGDLADYVEFVTRTGLRVEEALRLTFADFSGIGGDKPTMNVPGTKTAGSQAVLPMAAEAAEIVRRRGEGKSRRARLFPMRYQTLAQAWNDHARTFLGLVDDPDATLRALRRSFGRYATARGMPTEILRQYYRHADLATTQEYLRLVGGWSTEEMRRWVAVPEVQGRGEPGVG